MVGQEEIKWLTYGDFASEGWLILYLPEERGAAAIQEEMLITRVGMPN